jgi:hypothetical protein
VVGVSASGNDLTKTAPETTWNAGAASVQALVSDGYVEFTTAEATAAKMAGLSMGNGGADDADIDFAVRLSDTGRVAVLEGGVNRGGFGTYVAGDVFRVEVAGGVVTYAKNGAVFYTSTLAPSFPLLVDTSLRTPGATITDVAFEGLEYWTDPVRVAVNGRDITKTSADERWNAGARSVAAIEAGTGYVEFRPGDILSQVVAGLSNGSNNAGRNEIDHGIQLGADGKFGVIESGSFIGNYGTYTASDSFQVQVAGGAVTYLKDRYPFYTSTVVPTLPLLLDSSIRTPGARILDGRVVAGERADSCLAVQQFISGEEDPYYSSRLDAAGDLMVWTLYNRAQGVVRVHRRGPGGWQLEQRLVRADWEPIFQGTSATDGNTIAVTGGPQTGSRFVVVYRHDGSQWSQEAVLTGCPETPSYMGAAAVQGDVLVATGADGDGGRLFVYRRDATGAWPLEAVLTPAGGAGLGSSVRVGGDRIFITLGSASGVAVFQYDPSQPDPTDPPTCSNLDPGKWSQSWTLLAPPDHHFESIDVNRDGSRFVAGDSNYLRRGDLHVFNLVAGAWSEQGLVSYPRGVRALGRYVAFGGSGPNADSLLATSGYANYEGAYRVTATDDTMFALDQFTDEIYVHGIDPVCAAE